MKKIATLAAATASLLATTSAFAGVVILERGMDSGWIIVQRWIIVQIGSLFGA